MQHIIITHNNNVALTKKGQKMYAIEKRGVEILKTGVLPPDEKNILIFKKVVRDYALITCFAFASGIACAFPLAQMSSTAAQFDANHTSALHS